jgi:D-3-phosphoglycerate dehydrogenase
MKSSFKVVVTDFIEPDLNWEADEARRLGIEFEAHQLSRASEGDRIEATRDAHVVVVNMAPITRNLVRQWRHCELVIRHGVGYDNVDVEALTDHGIRFCNVPDYCVQEVAEQAIALIFNLVRKVSWSRAVLEQSSQAGLWNFAPIKPIHRLQGSTVGIVGLGRVGLSVYRSMQAFGARLLVCDPYLSSKRIAELNIEPISFEEVLRQSDILSLHAPLNAQTNRLINQASLSLMKPGAYLVNTARAGLIDHAALCQALRERRIAGAALDVYESEPPRPGDPLFDLDNVVLTPHLSWYSVEADEEIRRKIFDQILRYRDDLQPLNWLNEADLRKGVSVP